MTTFAQRSVKEEARAKADFAGVHACRPGSDIPDDRETRLVILGPDYPLSSRNDPESPARKEAAGILESRGASPRNYKNTLVFLAGDGNRLRELEQAARQYLAWSSICKDRETLNLDQFQSRQAETKRKTADETVDARIPECYQWLIVPGQSDPKGDISWSEIPLKGGDTLASRAAKKLKSEELLFTQLGGIRLKHELDRIPLWDKDRHVGVRQLCEYMARYLYLPRLRDDQVLIAAIHDGLNSLTWESETFAYAECWDEQSGKYKGLRAGGSVRVLDDASSLVIKPEIAKAQMDAETAIVAPKDATSTGTPADGTGGNDGKGIPPGGKGGGEPVVIATPRPNRFHGTVQLDPLRCARDAGKITEEVIQHLTAIVGTEVEVTLEIHAKLRDGADEKLIRDVTENCNTLKFTNYGFEEG